MTKTERPHPLVAPPDPEPLPTQTPQSPGPTSISSLQRYPPHLTRAALAIMTLIFVLRAFSPTINDQLQVAGWNLPQAILKDGEIHRLFTSIFLHAGIWARTLGGDYVLAPVGALHFLFNGYLLYLLGSDLEGILGHSRFALLFSFGGLSGSAFSVLFRDPCIPSLGASGMIFALISAQWVLLLRNRTLFGKRGAAMRRQILRWTLLNFAIGLASNLPGSILRIDNWAHLGGLLAGLALALAMVPRFQLRLALVAEGEGFRTQPLATPITPSMMTPHLLLPIALGALLVLSLLWRASTITPNACPF